MAPNNSLADKSDDSINDIIDQIGNIVINDNRCLSYTHVSQRFGVRVDIARNILKRFVSQHANNGNNLSVKYFLCGNNNNDDDDEELKIERFLIVDECELDSTRAMFKNLVVEDIYSVAAIDKDGNVPKFELNFMEYDCEVTNESQLKHIQSLTFKRNDNIGFRDIKRRGPPLPIVNSESNDVKSEDKSESKTNSQFTKVKSKTNNKRKNNIKSMFSNNSKNVKKEVVEEESKDETNMEDNDPFKSDSEDDIKEVSNNDTDEQQKPKIEDREETMSLKEEDAIEVIDEVKNVRNKRASKEQSVSSDEEDEEEIIITRTKKSKRFKRVRMIDSDDDEEMDDKEEKKAAKLRDIKQKAAKNLHLIASAKKDELKPVVKRVEVQETHVDDDGFTVTKTVKKDVIVDENENCDYIKPKANEKRSNGLKDNAKSKANSKSKTPIESKKSKSLKDTSNMKQMSITNFFKPKVMA